MPVNSPANTSSSAGRGFGLMALLLLAILACLFHRSFLPGEIVFSNDGPYGAINSAAGRLPSGFSGAWEDLNWLGSESVSASPDLSNTLAWFLQPLLFSKFYCPVAVLVLGLSAWVFFRQLGLATIACVVAGIAAMLNSDFFSTAAWGVASQPISFGANFLALAAITHSVSSRRPWLWTMVAGFCVGWGVMEAFDIGAIFSIFTAAYVLFQSWNTEGALTPPSKPGLVALIIAAAGACVFMLLGFRLGWGAEAFALGGVFSLAVGVLYIESRRTIKRGLGIVLVAVVTACACVIAIQTLNILIGTQIQGVAGTAQDKDTKQSQWDFATQWSVPKQEILQVLIPGVFGYRMDSPGGANYWGRIGENPLVPGLVEARDHGPDDETRKKAAQFLAENPGLFRFSGSGFYAGVVVLIVALWAVCQSLRWEGSPFTITQKRYIWFWLVVALAGILFGFGKYSVFYQFFYSLPYVSTIRNPTKFMHVFSWALVILFAYGVDGIYRVYLKAPNSEGKKFFDLSRISGFDQKWLVALALFLVLGAAGWIFYASVQGRSQIEAYIASVGFDAPSAQVIAGSSITAVAWFVIFLAATCCVIGLIFSGLFSGRRAFLGGSLLGLLVLLDLGRANMPWIIYWNVDYKYASNPIIDFLREKPYEHRVTMLPYGSATEQFGRLNQVYSIEWVQQMFPCYNIQSTDVIMEPRRTEDKAKFLAALPYPASPFFNLRTWELLNVRYLLGIGGGLVDALNAQIDPAQRRFHVAQSFNLVEKPGGPGLYPVDFTAEPSTNGELAVIEFTGALPRASLYSRWNVNTNDDATLKLLASPEFDPHKTVLVANPIPAPPMGNEQKDPGTVSIKPNYRPKRIEMEADVKTPSVLLLNDKFSPHWHAYVNGKPAEMLRCNYIVRGLYLQPGHYDIVFRYSVPLGMFYISVLAVLSSLGLAIWLGVEEWRIRRPPPAPAQAAAKRAESATSSKRKPVKV